MVQVYTGDGKGKTTAAFGLALRAIGHGMRVYMVQFLKRQDSGEVVAAKRLFPDLQIAQYGRPGPMDGIFFEDHRLAKEALQRAREVVCSGDYDVVILDEVNVALHFRLLKSSDVLELISQRPDNVELVLTGRHAPDELISAAQLVTEFVEVKHPHSRDMQARRGIDY